VFATDVARHSSCGSAQLAIEIEIEIRFTESGEIVISFRLMAASALRA